MAGFMVAGVIGYAVGGNGGETDRGTPTTQPSHPAATDTSAPVVPTDNRGTWPDAFENAFIEGFSRGYGSDSEDLAACALNTAEGEYPDWSSLPTQGTTEFQDLMEQMVIDCAEYAP